MNDDLSKLKNKVSEAVIKFLKCNKSTSSCKIRTTEELDNKSVRIAIDFSLMGDVAVIQQWKQGKLDNFNRTN